MPIKDPVDGKMICKYHMMAAKHKTSSLKPQVAIKTASRPINKKKIYPVSKPEDRELIRKRKRRKIKDSDSPNGYETNSGESSVGSAMNPLQKSVTSDPSTLR